MKSLGKFILLITLLLTTSLFNSLGSKERDQPILTSDLTLPYIESAIDSNVEKESKQLKVLLNRTHKELEELKLFIREKRIQDSLLIEYYATY